MLTLAVMSDKGKIDLRQHQQFKKSWKTILRLSIYTILVVGVCCYIYYWSNQTSVQKKQPEEIQAEEFEIEI